jgi:hypothetical protein
MIRGTQLAGRFVASVLLASGWSAAQQPQASDERRSLLDQAQAARAAARHQDALAFCRRAIELKSSSSLRRFAAEELAALGRAAEAYNEAERCIREAASEPPSSNHDAVFLGCRTLVHELKPRVALLSFDWGGAEPSGVVIQANGATLDTEHENAVAPGMLSIEAVLPTRLRFTDALQLGAGEAKTIDIRFEQPRSAPAEAPSALLPRRTSVRRTAPQLGATSHPGRSWGPVAAGVGGALAIAGGALLVQSASRYRALTGRCAPGQCSESDSVVADDKRAIQRLDLWGSVGLISGIGLLGGGVAWFALDRPPSGTRLSISLSQIEVRKSF